MVAFTGLKLTTWNLQALLASAPKRQRQRSVPPCLALLPFQFVFLLSQVAQDGLHLTMQLKMTKQQDYRCTTQSLLPLLLNLTTIDASPSSPVQLTHDHPSNLTFPRNTATHSTRFHTFVYVCMCGMTCIQRSKNNFWEWFSLSTTQILRLTQVIRFSSKYLNPLSPCASWTLPLLSGLAKGLDFHLVWRLEVQKQINSVSDNCISHEKRCTEMMGGGMQGELSNPESCAGLPVNLVNQSEPQMILWNWHI